MLDNNLNVVDLSDLDADLPLDIVETKQILSLTEDWENSSEGTPLDSLGYPSIVKNDRGPNPDNKFYLYYAHHDIPSRIGCAVAAVSYTQLRAHETGRNQRNPRKR